MILEFGSLWAYSPNGTEETSAQSRDILKVAIKQWRLLKIADRNFEPEKLIYERLNQPEHRELFRSIFFFECRTCACTEKFPIKTGKFISDPSLVDASSQIRRFFPVKS